MLRTVGAKTTTLLLTVLALSATAAFFTSSQTTSAATTLVKPPNNLGLVGYWSFNEGAGTIATDFSGNGNKGTLTTAGTVIPTWTNGKLGKALSIASADQSYVTVASNNTLTVSGSHTISAWVKPTAIPSSGNFSTVAGKYGTSNLVNYALFLDNAFLSSGDGIGFIFYNDGTCWAKFSSTPQTGQWYHLVGVFDTNATTMTLYINGVQQAQAGTCSLPTGSGEFWIGRDRGTNGANWDGVIDEVRVYNRALSPSEVAYLYNVGSVKINASSADLDNGSTLEQGLIANWTFDGKDLTDKVYDRSGQGNNGYVTTFDAAAKATSSMKVLGKLGQGLRFTDHGDGNGDVIEIPNSTSVASNLTNMSLSAWYKTTSTVGGNGGTIMSSETNAGASGWIMFISGGLINLSDEDSGGHDNTKCVEAGNETNDGVWHHVVATLSGGGNGTITIYLDGTSRTLACSGSLGVTSYASSHNITIGDYLTGAPFDGTLDDVRIYNRTLSASEVNQLYKLGTVTVRPNP